MNSEGMQMTFTHKLVAVLNEKIEPGVVMNALAHMCIGLGAHVGKDALKLTTYVDADGTQHPYISQMPFIVLRTNSNKIRAARLAAQSAGVVVVDFTHTMTGGTYLEQLENTKQVPEEALVYYGVVLYGEWSTVSDITKKFSLWK
jgi:hypothetical protein